MVHVHEEEDDLNVTVELESAQAALEAFEASADRRRLVQRLKREAPLHPLLMSVRLCLGVGSFAVATAALWVAAVVLAVPLPAQILALSAPSAAMPAPLALSVIGGCSLVAAVCLHELAAMRGAAAPLLGDEQQQHQRLTADLLRLRALKSVTDRKRAGLI